MGQGSILGPLLFLIFICDLFDFEENVDITNYADDSSQHCADHDIQTTINTLQDSSAKLFDWFSKNSMKANADKCHLLLSENTKHVACINHIQITFHSRELNNKINRIHERPLRLVYSDKTSTFQKLLDKDKSISVYHKNIQVLATEIYKTVNGLAPININSIFEIKDIEYNLRNKIIFKSRRINSVRYGIGSLPYLGPKIWNIVPRRYRKI